MPNGKEYNQQWCDERHRKIDVRLDRLDTRIWAILIMLFVNLGGIGVLLFRG